MTALTPVTTFRGGTPPRRPTLSQGQKAAIIVRLLIAEGADIPISDLSEEMQEHLTHQMGEMRLIDRKTLTEVIEEFADMLEGVSLSFPDGLAGALKALDGKISPQAAARLRKQAGMRHSGDPWQRLRALELDEILPFVETESIEVAAVMLSKLDVAKAAAVLGRLPGEKARRVTYAISQTGAVTPIAVERIGLSLAAQLDARPERAFLEDPEERISAILNASPAMTRDEVLTGLDEDDRDFAQKVRKSIFTYTHIPERLEPRDVPKLTRAVDQDILVLAMAYVPDPESTASRDFILQNMSNRMAESLREQINDKGKVKAKIGEGAQTTVISALRDLQTSGEITLRSTTDEEDED